MFRRILSWKTVSVLFWGTSKDKEFVGKGSIFRRGVCGGGSLISEAGEPGAPSTVAALWEGVREGGQVESRCGLTPGLGASGEGLSYLALDLPLDKAALFQREGPAPSQGVNGVPLKGDPEICESRPWGS